MVSWAPMQAKGGGLLQSAVPKVTRSTGQRGLLLRGVVTQTYVFDSPEPANKDPSATTPTRQAVYCDVWCYGSRFRGHLSNVLVLQDRGGLHEGRIWKPRPSTIDVTGFPINLDSGTHFANLDGDHVLIGFIDGNASQPIILGGIPHPSSDIGNATRECGHRLRLNLADGQPDFFKHRGAFYGIDDSGNYLLDLTRAHGGKYEADGEEPAPALDGGSGNATIRMPEQSTLIIKLGDDRELKLEHDGAKFTLTLPGGDVNLKSDTVELGDGAGEAVVLGNTWTMARATLNAMLNATFVSIGAFMTAYATKNPPPTPDGTAATAAATACTMLGTAPGGLTQFEAMASSYLSTRVKTV